MKSPLPTYSVPLLAALLFAVAPYAGASDWPSWRGPSQTGSLTEGEYPTRWDSEKIAWKIALPGKGGSSPIVWRDKIFVSCPDGGENSVIAFDLQGTKLWQTKLGDEKKAKHKKLGSSCNASPVTDGEGVFVYFKSGHFAALELDGTLRWLQNLTEEFGAEKLFWDQGSSPVVVGDTVVLPRLHGGKSWVAAFDKKTGERRWLQPRDYKVPTENDNGYTTPVLFDHDSKAAMLIWGADHLTAHAADGGAVLWSTDGFNPDGTDFWPAISTPVIAGDTVVVAVGRDDRKGQARVHGIKLGGERAWKREDFGVFAPSPAEYKGKVYLLRHRGGLVCLDPATGDTVWAEELPRSSAAYYSSPLIAGGILYAAREDGVVFSVKVGEKFELFGENDMGEQIIATPVPVGGKRLLIRGAKHLFCVE